MTTPALDELALNYMDNLNELNDNPDSHFSEFVEDVVRDYEPGGDRVAVLFTNPKDGMRYRVEFDSWPLEGV
jgi:hypothetical protein